MVIIAGGDNNIIGLEGEDVIGLDYIHIEVKRVQALNLDDAMEQAKRDSKGNQLPAVFHRKNSKKWKVTMELDSWIKLYNEYYSSIKLKERGNANVNVNMKMYKILNLKMYNFVQN